MMHVGIPKSKSVSSRIFDEIIRFEVETGKKPTRLAVSSYLLSKLFDECLWPYQISFKTEDRRIFGLPCYTVADNNVIMASL